MKKDLLIQHNEFFLNDFFLKFLLVSVIMSFGLVLVTVDSLRILATENFVD